MGYLAQTAADISYVIDCVDFISNKDIINFNTEEQIIKVLEYSLKKVEEIDLMNLFNEIWNETSYPDRIEQAELLFNKNFISLLNWKNGLDNINDLQRSIVGDCISFADRQKQMKIYISSPYVNRMIELYQIIGYRLLKLKRDKKRIIEKIKQKVKEEKEEKEEKETIESCKYNKFILNPDKKSQFAAELSKLYKEGFFLAATHESEIREEDIMHGFQEFLDVELLPIDAANADTIIEKNLSVISTETNYEFENFLLHSNKHLLSIKIRETFKTEKGKAISLLLYALELNNPPLITIGNRQLKSIYRALQALLNRDIGTYQSVNYKYVEESDKPDLDSIRLKLNHILTELNKEQLA